MRLDRKFNPLYSGFEKNSTLLLGPKKLQPHSNFPEPASSIKRLLPYKTEWNITGAHTLHMYVLCLMPSLWLGYIYRLVCRERSCPVSPIMKCRMVVDMALWRPSLGLSLAWPSQLHPQLSTLTRCYFVQILYCKWTFCMGLQWAKLQS